MSETIKSYKGFDKDLKCRGFQYEIGKEYEEPEADVCLAGFHACERPLDVFNHYCPVNSRFCEVGEKGLAVARGNNVRVKGGLGAVLVIAEENESDYDIKDWAAVLVDGETIKADTFYMLKNGEFVVTE